MCIRDRIVAVPLNRGAGVVTSFVKADGIIHIPQNTEGYEACLLYASDAADDLLGVDLGGRRIITKKNNTTLYTLSNTNPYAQHSTHLPTK